LREQMARPNNSKQIEFRKIKCPWCGDFVKRPIVDELIGPADGRRGNSHFHKCFLISMNPMSTNPPEKKWKRRGREPFEKKARV